jgi:hypothetical protein
MGARTAPSADCSVPVFKKQPTPFQRIVATQFLRKLGPGLITGASDDDPSGIGTYSQAGAQLGYSIGWTMLLTYADGGDPGNQRTHRTHDGPRHLR